MASTKSSLSRELLRIGRSWPPDILRPRLQYGFYLTALSEQPDLPVKTVRSQQILLQNSLKDKYALSEKTLNPPSFPDKYARLVGLLEDAVETAEKDETKKKNGGLLGWFKG